MPDAYEVYEGRYLQVLFHSSGTNGLRAAVGPVPNGQVWTILSAMLFSSVAETQDFWFSILTRDGKYFPVTIPAEASVDTATNRYYPMLREGMELKLFPGESLVAYRDDATAGSSMYVYARFIASDLPYFQYREPLKPVTRKASEHGRAFASGKLSTSSMVESGEPGGPGGGGGGGEPEPVI